MIGIRELRTARSKTLLDMTLSPNWTQFILDCPMAHAPGAIFNYADANPNLASAIITRLTGKLAEDYARKKLFRWYGVGGEEMAPSSLQQTNGVPHATAERLRQIPRRPGSG